MAQDKETAESAVKSIFHSIQIALDDYNDIFSDFDVSSYEERTFSEDFMKELHKRYTEDKGGNFVLRLSLPKNARNTKSEKIIKKRFDQYFTNKAQEIKKTLRKRADTAFTKMAIGIFLLSLQVIVEYYDIKDLTIHLLSTFTIPAGWYLLYSSFESVFDHMRYVSQKQNYYQKLADARYEFIDEEGVIQPFMDVQNEQTAQQQKSK